MDPWAAILLKRIPVLWQSSDKTAQRTGSFTSYQGLAHSCGNRWKIFHQLLVHGKFTFSDIQIGQSQECLILSFIDHVTLFYWAAPEINLMFLYFRFHTGMPSFVRQVI